MEEVLPEVKSQSVHHMLTSSPWDHQRIFDKIFKRCRKIFKKHKLRPYLLIDEVGFRKKGKYSACVGRQYLGCIGKHDNGQVAVAAALSAHTFYCPFQIELFMPKNWEADVVRRDKAGIPVDISHRTKPQMALDMIVSMRKKIKNIQFVVFDALYGNTMYLLESLLKKKIAFVADVRENLTVYLEKPEMKIPANKGQGRKSTKHKPDKESIKVREYMAGLKKEDFAELKIRAGTNGEIKAKFHRKKVWILNKESNKILELILLIRKNSDGSIKYALCYSPNKVKLVSLARAQAQRIYVERVFEEGKNILGMGDYQTRSWKGFHRHMSLCSLAMLFLMEQKIKLEKIIGRVTSYQLHDLIKPTIKIRSSLEDIMEQVYNQVFNYQRCIARKLDKT